LSAGIVKTIPFKFLNKKDLQEVMSVNFESPVLLCQKLLKNKKVKKGGSIVFVSSIAGNLVADKGNSAYAASKAALNGMCKVMSAELAPQKIRVNLIRKINMVRPKGFISLNRGFIRLMD
jgi:NAD(P)-dependent dehydrogenase (short-subunit alcohol dehydrogenase family)